MFSPKISTALARNSSAKAFPRKNSNRRLSFFGLYFTNNESQSVPRKIILNRRLHHSIYRASYNCFCKISIGCYSSRSLNSSNAIFSDPQLSLGKSKGPNLDTSETQLPVVTPHYDAWEILRSEYTEIILMRNLKLNDYFLAEEDLFKVNDAFQNQWWTCEFTCPVTDEKFSSSKMLPINFNPTTGDPSKIITQTKDGKVFYKKRKEARQACAARVLDCYSHWGFWELIRKHKNFNKNGSKDRKRKIVTYPQLCKEDPSVIPADFEKKLSQFKSESIPVKKEPQLEPIDTLKLMHAVYDNGMLKSLDIDYEKKTIYNPDNKKSYSRWTASFQSPITREIFSSGTLQNRNSPVKVEVVDGKIYYPDKKNAKRAAIGRAVDCFIFRRSWTSLLQGDDKDFSFSGFPEIEHNRYCSEEPYCDTLPEREPQSSLIGREDIQEKTPHVENLSVTPIRIFKNSHLTEEKQLNGTKTSNEPCTLIRQIYPDTAKVKNAMHAKRNLDRMHRSYNLAINTKDKEVFTYDGELIFKNDRGIYCWTACFKSPVTKEAFWAGTLKSEEYPLLLVKDGKNYYANKKQARWAAIGRAVDCFAFRGGWLSLPNNKEGFRFPNSLLENDNYCSEEPYNNSPEMAEAIVIEEATHVPSKISSPSPKQVMTCRYSIILREPISPDSFKTESIDINSQTESGETLQYWTSIFKCPITEQKFYSGKLLELNSSDICNSPARIRTIDERVYYLHRKNAEHAAVGRASDCLTAGNLWSFFGINEEESVPRFCVEDPYIYNSSAETGQGALNGDESEEYALQNLPTEDDVTRSTMDVLLEAWSNSSLSTPTDISVNNSPEKETIFSKVTHGKSMIHELASQRDDVISMAVALYNKMEPENANNSGKKKSRRQKPKLSSTQQIPFSVFSCNAILKALGKANGFPQFSPENPGIKHSIHIEDLAKKILKSMISKCSDIDPPIQLNADTFNFFIKCLNPLTPPQSATKAESLLSDMISSGSFEGYSLPPPNVETFTAVINLWAVVAGKESYTKVAELFAKLESVMVGSDTLRPNRDTYLAVLSSLACQADKLSVYDTENATTFNSVEATKWIKIIEKQSLDDTEHVLRTDTELYNAALPWISKKQNIGKVIFNSSFDNYENLFKSGFRTIPAKSDHCTIDAKNIEKWLYNMEHQAIENGRMYAHPNIDSYESVIQAWIRVRTEEGLLRAETWALRTIEMASLDSTVLPHLQTFLPIIAAWAHCGTEKGPEHVEEWIERLEKLSSSMPLLKPNISFQAAIILAWYKYLLLSSTLGSDTLSFGPGNDKLNKANTNISIPTEISYQSAAEKCSESLEIICEELQEMQQNGKLSYPIIDSNAFNNVVDVWKNVAMTPRLNSEKNQQEILTKIFRVVHLLDDLISSIRQSESLENRPAGNAESNDEKTDKDGRLRKSAFLDHRNLLLSLIQESQTLRQNVIFHISDVCARTGSSGNNTLIDNNFHHVESMLRRSEEYNISFESSKSTSNQHLYSQIFKCCKLLKSSTRYGCAVRVVMYIISRLEDENKRCVKGGLNRQEIDMTSVYLEAVDVLADIIPNNIEKALLFEKIWITLDEESKVDKGALLGALKISMPSFDSTELQIEESNVRKHASPFFGKTT